MKNQEKKMNLNIEYEVLTEKEIKLIHQNALRILSEIGFKVGHPKMLRMFGEFGGKVNEAEEIVTFSPQFIEKFIADSEEIPPPSKELHTLSAGYSLNYMEPETGKTEPLTLKTITQIVQLSNRLKNIDKPHSYIGTPYDVPLKVNTLYCALLAWKYMKPFPIRYSCILNPKLCPYFIEMGEIMVEDKGGKLSDYIAGSVFLVPPLRLVRESAEIFLYFWERGLPAAMGDILSQGGTAPVTIAGAVSMGVAEGIFQSIISRIFYNSKHINVTQPRIFDMARGMTCHCRPEFSLMLLALAQMAKFYKSRIGGTSISCAAKLPSCEAGMERGFTAIPLILAGGRSIEGAGHLSVDEVVSPVQMVIDNEYYGALKRFVRGFEVNEETLAFEVIKEVGQGGTFMGTEHTLKHYRKEQWQPEIFSREAWNTWIEGDKKIDVDYARDIAIKILKEEEESNIGSTTEEKLMKIIKKAEENLK